MATFGTDRTIIDLNAKDMFSIETLTSLQKFSGDKIDVKNKIVRGWPMIELDAISRNRSLYESTGYVQALESVYIQELLRRGTWFGELDHPPMDCTRDRFLMVLNTNINHRIMRYWRTGSTIFGDIQFVRPRGVDSWDWVEKGINLSLSTRILTPNYRDEVDAQGNPYVYKYGQMRLVTFDMISSAPGFRDMNIADINQYNASAESWAGIRLKWPVARKREEFVRLLKSQETLPIMQDIYGFELNDRTKIAYSKEGLITIETERKEGYSRSIKIPTNTYLVNRALTSGM